MWANNQDWTDDLILTMDVLYQLSYIGNRPQNKSFAPARNTAKKQWRN